MNDQPLLITDVQAAALAGIARSTWHVLRSAGKIGPPAIRLGRAVRYRRADVEAWITAGCPDSQTWAAMAATGRRLRVV
jgi:predicted DNA-binding transcriptional regulator AlpA